MQYCVPMTKNPAAKMTSISNAVVPTAPMAATNSAANAKAVVRTPNGMGRDRTGVEGLSILDDHGIAAASVAAMSARIGSGLSTYYDGIISACNSVADERAFGSVCEPKMRPRSCSVEAKLTAGWGGKVLGNESRHSGQSDKFCQP